MDPDSPVQRFLSFPFHHKELQQHKGDQKVQYPLCRKHTLHDTETPNMFKGIYSRIKGY